jgi:hypothetical protein
MSDINTAREAAAYLREEADFNRSWTDGRRGGCWRHNPGYVARRIELAEQAERLADAVDALADRAIRIETMKAFQAMAPRASLPWTINPSDEAGCIRDSVGDLIVIVDADQELSNIDAISIAAMIITAVNTCAGYRCEPVEKKHDA